MDLLSNLLSKSVCSEEDLNQLVQSLNRHLPGESFQVVPDEGRTISSGKDLSLTDEVRSSLLDKARKENTSTHAELPGGMVVHAMPIRKLNAVLIVALPVHGPGSGLNNYGIAAVRLCVELFTTQKTFHEEQKRLNLQKIQITRKDHALENKYQEMLIDLVRANEVAASAETVKREFLSNVSHEIRTPLSGIIGMSEIAIDSGLDDNQREIIDTINSEAKALHDLINNILDFSKLDAGKFELDEIPFNLRSLLNDVSAAMAFKAEQKGLEFITFISSEVPYHLIGDPGRIRQVIVNLAGNSMKFTQEGEILIRVELAEEMVDRVKLRLLIKDTGIGIPESKQKTIFEAFVQADASTASTYGGTGLGTTISKQLTEQMGGEIGVESEEGKGSTFWFTAVLTKEKIEKGVLLKQKTDLSGKNVMVVSANSTVRFALGEYLRSWGCFSLEASDVTEALSIFADTILSEKVLNLIISDIELPGKNGFDMAREVRSNENAPDVPIIILTSLGFRGDGKKCNDLGINGYLTKPVNQDDLYKAIVSVLSFQGGKGQQKGPQKIVTKHTIYEESSQKVRILLVEDHPTNQKVATYFLNQGGHQVDLAENGLLGFEAYKRNQYDIIFMDMQMPVMGGYEAAQKIREYEAEIAAHSPQSPPHIPIVALTAHAVKKEKDKCFESGMDDFMTKPTNKDAILTMVDKWTASKAGPKNNSEDQPDSEQSDDEILSTGVPINYEAALEQYDGDKEFLTDILNEFLEKTEVQVTNIRQAISDGNTEVVTRESHSIKGGSAILNANDLSAVAYELQNIGESGSLDNSTEVLERLEKEYHRLKDYIKEKGSE